jgi:hypothetical protein
MTASVVALRCVDFSGFLRLLSADFGSEASDLNIPLAFELVRQFQPVRLPSLTCKLSIESVIASLPTAKTGDEVEHILADRIISWICLQIACEILAKFVQSTAFFG